MSLLAFSPSSQPFHRSSSESYGIPVFSESKQRRWQSLSQSTAKTQEEFAHIKQHPAHGALMLEQMGMLSQVRRIVYHHHEHWDGSGYPAGLQGETIPLGARIVAIADAFEVMTSHRPYQAPRTPTQALEELRTCAGIQFDPVLVERFCTSLEADLPSMFPFVPGRCVQEQTKMRCWPYSLGSAMRTAAH